MNNTIVDEDLNKKLETDVLDNDDDDASSVELEGNLSDDDNSTCADEENDNDDELSVAASVSDDEDGNDQDDTATQASSYYPNNGHCNSDDSINDDVIHGLITDTEEDMGENFKKLTAMNYREYIEKHHPQLITHTMDEIRELIKVVRNEQGIIIDALHKTLPFLTKFEYTRVIGQRAKQIASGCLPFIDIPPGLFDPVVIAEMELRAKKIPFIIKRPICDTSCEYWALSDLDMIDN